MNWIYWKKGGVKVIFGILSLKAKPKAPVTDIGEVMTFLIENPDKMFIPKSRDSAYVYYPPTKQVIRLEGDFDGSSIWCNFELQRQLSRLKEDED